MHRLVSHRRERPWSAGKSRLPRSNADAMQHASLSSAGMTARTILIVQARRKFSQLDSRIRLPGVTLKPSARTAELMDVSSQYRCPCGQAQGRAQPVRGKRPAPCPPVGKVSATPRHKTQAGGQERWTSFNVSIPRSRRGFNGLPELQLPSASAPECPSFSVRNGRLSAGEPKP